MTAKVLAGPRFDSLRFALVDDAAYHQSLLQRLRQAIQVVRTSADVRENHRGICWNPAGAFHLEGLEAGELTEGRRLRLFKGSDNTEATAPTCRPVLGGSGYLATFHSPDGGPGYLAVKDPLQDTSVHPYQFDLASSWLWSFPDALSAAQAAVSYWSEWGVLHGEICAPLLLDFETHRVTRADVCVDHTLTRGEWGQDDLERFAGRAKSRGFAWLSPPRKKTKIPPKDLAGFEERQTRKREVYYGPRSLTLYIGSRKATFLRIYDKTAEVKAKSQDQDLAKYHAAPIWKKNGWDGVKRVWRAEVQVCSKSLHYLSTAYGEPMRQLGAISPGQLWALYCQTMRHVDLTATRLSRCPTSSRWQALSLATRDDQAHRSPVEVQEVQKDLLLFRLRKQAERCSRIGDQATPLVPFEEALKVLERAYR